MIVHLRSSSPVHFYIRHACAAIGLSTIAAALTGMTPVLGQEPARIDSIEQVIASAKDDTTRIGAMLALGEAIYMTDPDRNWELSAQALTEAENALQRSGMAAAERRAMQRLRALASNNKAVSHFIYGELDSALTLFRDAEAIYKRVGPAAREADALNNQGLVYGVLGDVAEQRRCLTTALQVYEREGDEVNAANARINIGNHLREQGHSDSALHYFGQALEVLERLKSDHGVASCVLNIGQALAEQGEPVPAMEHLLRCEVMFEALGDVRGLAVCFNNIASIQMDLGATVEALQYLHRALELNTSIGAKAEQATNQLNIGGLLERQGHLDLAKERFEQCLSLYTETGDQVGLTIVHGQLGDLLKKSGSMDQAAVHFNEAVRLAEGIGHPSELANAKYKLAHFKKDLGDLAAAMHLFHQALELDLSTDDKSSTSQTQSSIAELHLKLGDNAAAIEWAGKALATARVAGYPKDVLRAAGALHEALVRKGRWQEALEMLQLYHQMKDSVENAEQAKQVLRLQLEHVFHHKQLADSLAHQAQVEELEHEREVAELRSRQARDRSWAMGAGLFLSAIGGGTIYRLDRKRRKERHERHAAQLQMRLLRAQMNPHFLFNALHGLHGYIQDNERELATAFLARYTRLMRLVLEHSRQDEITLAEELEVQRLYLDLEQERMNGRFQHSIEVAPGIDPGLVVVPPLVVQPILENAIWHGISPKQGMGHIQVKVERDSPHLRFVVEDDGVGRERVPHTSGANGKPLKGSLGTTITKERLELIGQRYGTDVELRYVEVPVGTRAEIRLPWVQNV